MTPKVVTISQESTEGTFLIPTLNQRQFIGGLRLSRSQLCRSSRRIGERLPTDVQLVIGERLPSDVQSVFLARSGLAPQRSTARSPVAP
jgi:hypothetical protein